MNSVNSDIQTLNSNGFGEEIDAQEFVKKASQKGVAEIEAAHTALEKAELNQVREFAQRMILDHGDANQKLKSIATQQGFEVEDDASLIDKTKKVALQLRRGESFDQAYIQNQINAHEKAIELFEKGTRTNNQPICAFAGETLPKLRAHLNQAQQIHAAIE